MNSSFSVMASTLHSGARFSLQLQEVRATAGGHDGPETPAWLKEGPQNGQLSVGRQLPCLPNVVIGCQQPHEPQLVWLRTIWYVRPLALGAIFR